MDDVPTLGAKTLFAIAIAPMFSYIIFTPIAQSFA
jgi:hypothetical protein